MEYDRFRMHFLHKKVLLPVIHAVDEAQVMENAHIAYDVGADGIFLINHEIGVAKLLTLYTKVRQNFPEYFIGLNMLGLSPIAALDRLPQDCDGLWTDNAGIDEIDHSRRAAEFLACRSSRHNEWEGLYFGGIAFKGQEAVEDYARAAKTATRFMDVVTTSGPRTGVPPELSKIKEMRDALGVYPLANASGISPENVDPYIPLLNAFLVADGISDSFTKLNPERTRALVRKIHSA